MPEGMSEKRQIYNMLCTFVLEIEFYAMCDAFFPVYNIDIELIIKVK